MVKSEFFYLFADCFHSKLFCNTFAQCILLYTANYFAKTECMEHKPAIDRVVEFFDGSTTKVAIAIGGKVVRQNVDHWVKTKRIPSDFCPQIEQATNGLVRCEDMRPDVAWSVLRQSPELAQAPVPQPQTAQEA